MPSMATVDGYRPPAETRLRIEQHGPYVPDRADIKDTFKFL